MSVARKKEEIMAYEKMLIIKSKGRMLFLDWNDIYLITAESNYVRIYCKNKIYRVRETLLEISRRLENPPFIRISRSSIVNSRYIRELRSRHSLSTEVLMENNQICYWSRSYRFELDSLIGRLSAV